VELSQLLQTFLEHCDHLLLLLALALFVNSAFLFHGVNLLLNFADHASHLAQARVVFGGAVVVFPRGGSLLFKLERGLALVKVGKFAVVLLELLG